MPNCAEAIAAAASGSTSFQRVWRHAPVTKLTAGGHIDHHERHGRRERIVNRGRQRDVNERGTEAGKAAHHAGKIAIAAAMMKRRSAMIDA